MVYRGQRFLTCPDCGHKSVYLRLAIEDGYTCRTPGCTFFAFTSGYDEVDVVARTRLNMKNPDRPVSEET